MSSPQGSVGGFIYGDRLFLPWLGFCSSMAGAEVSDVCGFAVVVSGFCSSMAGAEVSDVWGFATTVEVDDE
jgi:hypothetical protein